MNLSLTPSPRIVKQVRAHLERPVHEHRRWEVPSLTGDPRRTLTIVASRDHGADLGDGQYFAAALHVSLMAHLDGEATEMLKSDLDGWVRGILGSFAPFGNVPPPAQPGDLDFTPWSHLTTHVHVYLTAKGRPLHPTGPLANTPWAA